MKSGKCEAWIVKADYNESTWIPGCYSSSNKGQLWSYFQITIPGRVICRSLILTWQWLFSNSAVLSFFLSSFGEFFRPWWDRGAHRTWQTDPVFPLERSEKQTSIFSRQPNPREDFYADVIPCRQRQKSQLLFRGFWRSCHRDIARPNHGFRRNGSRCEDCSTAVKIIMCKKQGCAKANFFFANS